MSSSGPNTNKPSGLPPGKPGQWSTWTQGPLQISKSPDGSQVVASTPDGSHSHIVVRDGKIVHLDYTRPDGSKIDLSK
ncbi:MAG: hypothetical protein KatS3mg088_680 [Patescibacteria group bacterium]|nr:MAG: hypothetical protein KatS3mg088_680 [Patescibacteria group bacterium]